MQHVVFWVELASIAAGLAAFSLLVSVPRNARRAGAAPLAAGVLAQTFRLAFFAALRYGRLSRLRELPADRLDYRIVALTYRSALCVGAWFLSSWLLKRAGVRRNRAAAWAYWMFYASSALAVLAFGAAPRLPGPLRYLLVDVGPALVDKLAVLGSAAAWIAVAKNRAPGDLRGSPLEPAAVVLVGLAAVLDAVLAWLPSNPLFVLATALPFYAAAFLAYAVFRAESGAEPGPAGIPSRDTAAVAHAGTAAGTPAGTPVAAPSAERLLEAAGLRDPERRLAAAVLRGRSNKEIAYEEGLSLSAVKHRLYDLYRRLGVASRYELIALAAGERLTETVARPGSDGDDNGKELRHG